MPQVGSQLGSTPQDTRPVPTDNRDGENDTPGMERMEMDPFMVYCAERMQYVGLPAKPQGSAGTHMSRGRNGST